MARYVAKVTTNRSPEDAFAYMSDLTNFAEWDPGVTKVEVVEGAELDPPLEVDVTVTSVVGELTLRYALTQFEPHRRAVAKAETRILRSLDIILVEPTDDGCVVTYDAELTLRGPLAPLGGLLQPAFNKIGDKAAAGMADALDGTLVEA
ncbi:MAG: SRPBCC family protein [Actinomycetota bacterium]